MNLYARLLQETLPGRVLGVHVGCSRTAVVMEVDGEVRCGLAATLTNPEYQHHSQPAVRQAGSLLDLDGRALAGLVESPSFTETAIGLAAVNALLPRDPAAWVDLKAEAYLAERGAGRRVALIGHFPFAERLKAAVGTLWVLELNPREGDLPAGMAPHILPQADILAVTATTLINRTFDGLMALRRPDAEVVMIGPSTPLSPALYEYGPTILSGSIVTDPAAAAAAVSQGASLHQLRQAGLVRFVTMRRG